MKENWFNEHSHSDKKKEETIITFCNEKMKGVYKLESRYSRTIERAIKIYAELRADKELNGEDICQIANILNALSKKC